MAAKHWWVQTGHQTIGKTNITSWIETSYVMVTKAVSKTKLTKLMTHKWKDNRNRTTYVTVRDMHADGEDMFKLMATKRPHAVKVYDNNKLAPHHYLDGRYYHVLSGTPKPGDLVMINGTCAIRKLKLGNYAKCFPHIYFGDPKKCKKVIYF